MEQIRDSGNRRQFDSGAVRDMAIGKGRCDLLPLYEVCEFLRKRDMKNFAELVGIQKFMDIGNPDILYNVLWQFSNDTYKGDTEDISNINAVLEVAVHYEAGCLKYGEHNWEKGIPLHSFIDSAIRHYLKFKRGDDDERHDRAFVWNVLGALWTINNKWDYVDIPSVVKWYKDNE